MMTEAAPWGLRTVGTVLGGGDPHGPAGVCGESELLLVALGRASRWLWLKIKCAARAEEL